MDVERAEKMLAAGSLTAAERRARFNAWLKNADDLLKEIDKEEEK